MEDREAGSVKWFSSKKGYGFITRESGEDIFVHFKAIDMEGYKTLNQGDDVVFKVGDSDKGLEAQNVVLKEAS